MQTPILFIIFNRPETTQIVFDAIRNVRPKYLYVAADGPRNDKKEDVENCMNARAIINQIDWDCEVKTLFQQDNLGCYRGVNTALNWFFENVEQGIIIEDDCCPTENFFKFMNWGLETFKNDSQIGMISGSNLIEHQFPIPNRNGFSQFIHIWGWASWRNVWKKHNSYLTIYDIQKSRKAINTYMNFKWWQAIFWHELFKYTAYLGQTWDFQLIHSFFRLKLLAVYPSKNLVLNIGFSGNGTSTTLGEPAYVTNTKPKGDFDILELSPNLKKEFIRKRDDLLAKEIWSCNPFLAFRYKLFNLRKINR